MIKKILFDILEREFKENDYKGNSNSDFAIRKGKYPVLISAPHTITHINSLGKEKLPEYYVGSLSKSLSYSNNVFLIYKTGNKSHFESDEVYKNAIKQIVENYNIQLFIELHGCKDTYNCDVEIGTNDGKNIQNHPHIDLLLFDFFKINKIENIFINKKFKASKDYTNSKWVYEQLKVSAIQIEVSSKFRNSNNLHIVYNSLNSFINYIKSVLQHKIFIGRIGCTNNIKPLNRLEVSGVKEKELSINQCFHIDTVKRNELGLLLKKVNEESIDSIPTFNVTKRTFNKRKYTNSFAILIHEFCVSAKYLKPPFEEILGQDECLVSESLWLKLNEPKRILIRNDDVIFKLKVKKAIPREGDYVFLNYFQRHLLELELPFKITQSHLDYIQQFDDGFGRLYTKCDNFYALKEMNKDDYYKASLNYKNHFGSFSVYAINNKSEAFNTNFIFDFFIGIKSISLRSCRSFGIDEANNIVRISKDNAKVLGIEEGDRVIINSLTKKVKAKILFFENTDHLLKENGIIDKNNIEYLVSIPIYLRGKLNIDEVGEVISIKRDSYFLLLKNINTQFFSLIGMVITIFTLPEEILPDNLKIITLFVLLPFVFWLTFSKERSKIK